MHPNTAYPKTGFCTLDPILIDVDILHSQH
jgi:hypothetical protein